MMRIMPFVMIPCLLCGCYLSTPVTGVAPQAGDQVVVDLTDNGTSELTQYLGANVQSVDGDLLASNDSTIMLAVRHVDVRSGDDQNWNGEHVMLPRDAIASMRERKLSKWRTGLLAGVALAGALAIRFGGIGNAALGRQSPPGGQTK
ncbi:MAG: hypothetical protein ACREOJ_12970 [Gemmatimonadaceae bacterium]